MILHRFLWEGSLTYLIACEKTSLAALIDPTENIEDYLNFLEKNSLKLTYIIDTHSHADHVSGAGKLVDRVKAMVLMNRHVLEQREISKGKGVDLGIDQILKENGEIKVDRLIQDEEEIGLGNITLKFIHTPGHTLDSMCILIEGRVFTGDTLLIGQCGRTDLPGGSSAELYKSIFSKVLPLGDDLVIYPGHDYKQNINSVLGYEKIHNEFLKPRSEEDFIKFVAKFFPPLKVEGGGSLHCGIVNPTEQGENKTASPLMNQMCIAVENYFINFPNDWNTIGPEELKKKINAGEELFLLDVREPSEFAEGHLKDAVNISVRQLVNRVKELPKEQDIPIIVICRSGARAAPATLFLRGYGYSNVKTLEYGMLGWERLS